MTEKQDAAIEIEPVSAEDIMQALKEGAELYTNITESFVREFIFYDKTLYQWATDLMIEIPSVKNLDILSFRALLVDLATNIQIATNYYSVACSMVDAIGGGNSMKKSDIMSIIVSNYAIKGAKRPAATVIERMADSYLSSTTSAEKAAKIVKNFWKQRVDVLGDVRKILEQIGLSLNVEIKFTSA